MKLLSEETQFLQQLSMGFLVALLFKIPFLPAARKLLFFVGLVFPSLMSLPLSAQDLAYSKLLKGRVVQQSDSSSIPNVHVINLLNGRGTTSAADGTFRMMVEPNDKLLFTALGFHNFTFPVDSVKFENELPAVIVLEEKTYDLPIVEIYPYATFTDFKYAFLNFKDPEPGIELNLPKRFFNDVPGEGFGVTIKGPITALYDQFSKRGKELRNYQEVLVKEELHRKASRVVNVETIRRYTHLRDEAEIYRFLRFCNISDEYIVASNEYDVYQQLMACYQQYCEMEK